MLHDFYFERFDFVVALITFASIYLYLSGRYPYAFLLLAIGMMVKLYPGLLFPVFLVPLLASGRYRDVLKQTAVFIGAAILMIVPFVIWSPDNFLNFITYHNARGLQIESLFASLVMVAEMFGLTWTYTTNSFFSFNIEGGPTQFLASVSFPLMFAAILVFLAFYYLHCKRVEEECRPKTVIWASMIMLMIFVLLNKVFSIQYMVWIFMMALPMALCFDRERMRTQNTLLVLSTFLTFLFIGIYSGLCYHDPYVVLILFIRNMILVLLLAIIIRDTGICGTAKSALQPRQKPERESG